MLAATGRHRTHYKLFAVCLVMLLGTLLLWLIDLGYAIPYSVALLPYALLLLCALGVTSRMMKKQWAFRVGLDTFTFQVGVIAFVCQLVLILALLTILLEVALNMDGATAIPWTNVFIPLYVAGLLVALCALGVFVLYPYRGEMQTMSLVTGGSFVWVCFVLPVVSFFLLGHMLDGASMRNYGMAFFPVVITVFANCGVWYCSCSVYWSDATSESLPLELRTRSVWSVYHCVTQVVYMIYCFVPVLVFFHLASERLKGTEEPRGVMWIPLMMLFGGLALFWLTRPIVSKLERWLKYGSRLSPALMEAIRSYQHNDGHLVDMGLVPTEIAELAQVVFEEPSSDTEKLCVICQFPFEEGELLTALWCTHKYHTVCAERWLGAHRTCPLCLANVLDGPGGAVAEPTVRMSTIPAGKSSEESIDLETNDTLDSSLESVLTSS